MDAILTPLIGQGISGVMAASFIYFCWYVLTKTMPEQRSEFLTAIKEHRVETLASAAAQREADERCHEKVVSAVNALAVEVKSICKARIS